MKESYGGEYKKITKDQIEEAIKEVGYDEWPIKHFEWTEDDGTKYSSWQIKIKGNGKNSRAIIANMNNAAFEQFNKALQKEFENKFGSYK